jgi:GNAT superfamily N-acetyltransferase
MSVEIGTATGADELREALGPIFHFFGTPGPAEQDPARLTRVLAPERVHAVREDGVVAGGAGAFSFELTVPGGCVPAAGVTLVGVLPTQRRRGILRSLMRAQLDDVRERGEPVAYLWASEATIYPRFGYGLASLAGGVEIRRDQAAFAVPPEPFGRGAARDDGRGARAAAAGLRRGRRPDAGHVRALAGVVGGAHAGGSRVAETGRRRARPLVLWHDDVRSARRSGPWREPGRTSSRG